MTQKAALLFLGLAAALTLTACDDSRRSLTPASAQATSATMPPARVGACTTSALVDEKCTAAWYSCSDGRGSCAKQWRECCNATTSSD